MIYDTNELKIYVDDSLVEGITSTTKIYIMDNGTEIAIYGPDDSKIRGYQS